MYNRVLSSNSTKEPPESRPQFHFQVNHYQLAEFRKVRRDMALELWGGGGEGKGEGEREGGGEGEGRGGEGGGEGEGRGGEGRGRGRGGGSGEGGGGGGRGGRWEVTGGCQHGLERG